MTEKTIWGIHMRRTHGLAPIEQSYIAIGWREMGDLSAIEPYRDAFKAAYERSYSPDPVRVHQREFGPAGSRGIAEQQADNEQRDGRAALTENVTLAGKQRSNQKQALIATAHRQGGRALPAESTLVRPGRTGGSRTGARQCCGIGSNRPDPVSGKRNARPSWVGRMKGAGVIHKRDRLSIEASEFQNHSWRPER